MKSIFRISAVLFILAVTVSLCSAGVLSVSDLKSAKIGVLSGSVSEALAEAIISGDKSGTVIPYGSISEIIDALRSRDIDAAVMDESPARYFAIGSKEFRIIPEPVESEYYAIAFKKGNALRDEVDKALDALIADKTLAGIIARYLDEEPDPTVIDMNVGAEGGKLWVGCAASFPPYEMRTSEGFSGIDIELCAALAKKLVTSLAKKLGADGYNIVQNNGETAGQTVFHFHMHLIPRYKDDGQRIGWEPGKPSAEELSELAGELKDLF